MTRQLLRKADGVVLMYDVTSPESFAHVRYWLDCLQVSRWRRRLAPVSGVRREPESCPRRPSPRMADVTTDMQGPQLPAGL